MVHRKFEPEPRFAPFSFPVFLPVCVSVSNLGMGVINSPIDRVCELCIVCGFARSAPGRRYGHIKIPGRP